MEGQPPSPLSGESESPPQELPVKGDGPSLTDPTTLSDPNTEEDRGVPNDVPGGMSNSEDREGEPLPFPPPQESPAPDGSLMDDDQAAISIPRKKNDEPNQKDAFSDEIADPSDDSSSTSSSSWRGRGLKGMWSMPDYEEEEKAQDYSFPPLFPWERGVPEQIGNGGPCSP